MRGDNIEGNPFERGDIVKTHWGFYGIVGMSSEYWKERVAQKKQCISPLDLERYEPKWEDGTMDQLLLVAQHIYRNDGYISDYFYWLERYAGGYGKIQSQIRFQETADTS